MRWIALLLGLLTTGAVQAGQDCSLASQDHQEILTAISEKIDAEREKDGIQGLTYAAFHSGCVLFSGASGVADVSTGQALDPSASLFRVASVSKLFAVTAAMQLVQERVLDLEASLLDLKDVPFVRYLLEHESPTRLQQWRRIQVKHLMSHQAGISKDLPGATVFYNSESIADHSYPTIEEFFRGLTLVEFLYPPGQVEGGTKYSNLAMNMLARIVAGVNREGLSFPGFVDKHIYQPLGMRNSAYDLNVSQRALLTTGYGTVQPDGEALVLPKVFHVGSYDGSIGVASTSEDLAKFGQFLLRMAQFKSNALLQNEHMIKTLLTPASNSKLAPPIALGFGPFWRVMPGDDAENGPLWVGHSGTGFGERAIVMASPELNFGVVVNFNNSRVNREKYLQIIAKEIGDRFAEVLDSRTQVILQKTREVIATPLRPAPEVSSPAVPVQKLQKYLGKYFADNGSRGVYEEVTLSESGRLVFFGKELITEDADRGLFRVPMGNDVLFNYEPVVFLLDNLGRPLGLTIAQVKHFRYFSALED